MACGAQEAQRQACALAQGCPTPCSWLMAEARSACAECVCPEQAVRDDDLLRKLLIPWGEDIDDPAHLDLYSDGLFDELLDEGGPKRKRAPALKRVRVRPQCSVDGCTNVGEAYGLCKRHSGTTHIKRCSYQDCSNRARGSSGLCIGHSTYATAVAKAAATGLPAPDTVEAKDAKAKDVKGAEATKATETAKAIEARLAGATTAYLTAQGAVPPQQSSLPGVSGAAGHAADTEYTRSGDWDASLRAGAAAADEAAVKVRARHKRLTEVAELGDAAGVERMLRQLQGQLLPMAYAAAAMPAALALLDHAEGNGELLAELDCMRQDGGVLAVLGLGSVNDRISTLLRVREDAAFEAGIKKLWDEQPSCLGGPPSQSQLHLNATFANPTDFENWHPHLRQWAIRLGLHHRWKDLAHVPGGVQLRAENMLNALSGFFSLAVDGQDVASIAVSETYAQQVPAQDVDVREWLLRSWWWRCNGELRFVGCLQSARQLAYLLHNRTGARLPHSPPKPGDHQFKPFNIFLDPRFHLRVMEPTEEISSVNVLLARRVVCHLKAELKFKALSAPGATMIPNMGQLQFEALQRHPKAHLVHVPDPSNPADYTPAGPSPFWFATFSTTLESPLLKETLEHFKKEGCLLKDAGHQVCNEKAYSDWKAQPSQPAPEDGKVMVDPASCTKHYRGNVTTRSLPPGCLAETCYAPTTPDPEAPPGLPTNQATGLTMIRAGRMHRWRELMPEVEQMPKRQRTSELEVTELEVLEPA